MSICFARVKLRSPSLYLVSSILAPPSGGFISCRSRLDGKQVQIAVLSLPHHESLPACLPACVALALGAAGFCTADARLRSYLSRFDRPSSSQVRFSISARGALDAFTYVCRGYEELLPGAGGRVAAVDWQGRKKIDFCGGESAY